MQSLEVLQHGIVDIEGLIPDSSNGAIKVSFTKENNTVEAIIKPTVSIRPLWDFPNRDLNNREHATFLFDQELGLNMVPPTVLRDLEGIGQLLAQEWIEEIDNDLVIVKSPDEIPKEYLKVLQGYDELNKLITLAHKDTQQLRNLCLFDLVINNADRKGGHLLTDRNERNWAIYHGVTWHEEPKIRTVLWGWIGQKFNDADNDFLSSALMTLEKWEKGNFEYLLSSEIKQGMQRTQELLKNQLFPRPGDQWPAVPWPIF